MTRQITALRYPAQFARAIGLVAALFTTPLSAEPMANLAPGDFAKIIRDYDVGADRFTNSAPNGEADACFQVTLIDDQGVHLVLISGFYHPWWSETLILPGAADVWSNSPGYLENRPDAAPLDLIRQIFRVVDGCPAA